jgi:hypothetical protein
MRVAPEMAFTAPHVSPGSDDQLAATTEAGTFSVPAVGGTVGRALRDVATGSPPV